MKLCLVLCCIAVDVLSSGRYWFVLWMFCNELSFVSNRFFAAKRCCACANDSHFENCFPRVFRVDTIHVVLQSCHPTSAGRNNLSAHALVPPCCGPLRPCLCTMLSPLHSATVHVQMRRAEAREAKLYRLRDKIEKRDQLRALAMQMTKDKPRSVRTWDGLLCSERHGAAARPKNEEDHANRTVLPEGDLGMATKQVSPVVRACTCERSGH